MYEVLWQRCGWFYTLDCLELQSADQVCPSVPGDLLPGPCTPGGKGTRLNSAAYFNTIIHNLNNNNFSNN